jgi:pilus assembly protein CpaC
MGYLKYFIYVTVVCVASSGLTKNLIVLEKGSLLEIPLRQNDSIGIDRKEFLGVRDLGSRLRIQGVKEGTTMLRVGSKSLKVVVGTSAQLKTFNTLTSLLSLYPELSLDHADGLFYLSGKLDHASTWLTLANYHFHDFRMDVEASTTQLKVIEYELNKKLIAEGFFPVHLIQNPAPTVRLPSRATKGLRISELINEFGINIKEDSTKLYSDPLVRVQVLLVEVRKSYAQNIGIEWPNQMSAKVVPTGFLPNLQDTSVVANFFARNGAGKILSSPVLMAKSGSEAEFFAGGEFPIKAKSKQISSVIWKKYGIALKIKPFADSDGKISLDLSSEVSSIDVGQMVDGIPSLFTNTISSHFDLHHSQTIALSGLIKKIDGESIKRWPGLGEIPYLGGVFSSRDYQEDKTEIVVFVTPFIVEQE